MNFLSNFKANLQNKALVEQQEEIKRNTEDASNKLKTIEAQILAKEKELFSTEDLKEGLLNFELLFFEGENVKREEPKIYQK